MPNMPLIVKHLDQTNEVSDDFKYRASKCMGDKVFTIVRRCVGPRVLVKTARNEDVYDKLVRETSRLQPYIDGMSKNGRRNIKMQVFTCVCVWGSCVTL
jgi:hypothetical protein